MHAVVYFAPEPQELYRELGLRGYWRGYFASRAAALGPVGPELVTALFAGFSPAMVARAVPEVWSLASPCDVLTARSRGAAAALERLLDPDHQDLVVRAAARTRTCLELLPLPGRPMAAALLAQPRPDEPLAALWYDCTVLREHRGDSHIGAVAAAGLRWPEPHLLKGAAVDARQQELRGWDDDTWHQAGRRASGVSRDALEQHTDRLAADAYAALDDDARQELVELLEPLAARAGRQLPYPNAMGLPPTQG